MGERFDTEVFIDSGALFDADYLYFYERLLSDERSDAETDLIWRMLGLRPGMSVLDVPCGHGRIANRLAARGCRVTGVDAAPLFLDRARRDAAGLGVSVDYVKGDMCALPWKERFDRVLNWFTAFGYLDDAGNRKVLSQIAGALRPGGWALFDLINRDRLVRDFQREHVLERDGDLIVDRHRLDPLTSRLITERIVVRDGRVRRIPFFVRLFTFTELRDWLLAAGFIDVHGFGPDGEPFAPTSHHLIVTARR